MLPATDRLTCKSFRFRAHLQELSICSLARVICSLARASQIGSLARAINYSLARVFAHLLERSTTHLLECSICSLARAFNPAHLQELSIEPNQSESASSAGGGCSVVPVIHPRQWRLVARGGWSVLPVIPLPLFTTNLASTYIALTANLQVASLTSPLGKVCWKSSLIFRTFGKNVDFWLRGLPFTRRHHLELSKIKALTPIKSKTKIYDLSMFFIRRLLYD